MLTYIPEHARTDLTVSVWNAQEKAVSTFIYLFNIYYTH